MAVKKQLVQIDKQIQGSLASPGSDFVAFGAKSDGLYQLRNGQTEEKLAVEKVIIIYQIGHGFAVGNAIKLSGTTWVKAKADSTANAGTDGLVTEVVDANNFKYSKTFLEGSFTNGANYYLSPTTAGAIFIQTNPETWSIGEVREFIGTGTPNGLDINIDVGQEITSSIIPVSIWDLLGIDRTGWAVDKVLKFDANGNLIVGIDIQGTGGTGITLASLSGVGAIAYNPTTGAFSIASGYSVPTTTEKSNFQSAFNWGNHANSGYLTAITKALVEAVLTGNIGSHSHSYDNYQAWFLYVNGSLIDSIDALGSVTFQGATGIELTASGTASISNITVGLRLDQLATTTVPNSGFYIPMSGGANNYKVSPATLATLLGVGSGGGGVTDHGALSGLGDDDHTQYYNQTRGDARFAQKAGSSSQDFATKNLTAAQTIVATGTITGSEVYRGSARKLKKNIKILKIDALSILKSTKICEYDLRVDNSHAIGFIADDTHQLLAGEGKDKHLFGNHLALLTKAIQEQDQQISDLKKELEEMKKLIKKLTNARG